MRTTLFLFLAVLFPVCALEVHLLPEPAAAGEILELTLSDDRAMPRLAALPVLPNATWIRQEETRAEYSAARIRHIRTYKIRLNKEGELQIPELTVRVGKETEKIPPRTLRVLPAATRELAVAEGSMPLEKAVFGRFEFQKKDRKYFVGEEIPADLVLYSAIGLEIAQLEYPQVEFSNAVFADLSGAKGENRHFAPPREERRELDGKLYRAIVFPTRFRLIEQGLLLPAARTRLAVVRNEQRKESSTQDPFGDDFFREFFSRNRRQFTPITIEFPNPSSPPVAFPLPSAPKDALLLPLVGDWEIAAKLDATAPRVGEILTLHILARSATETGRPNFPQLQLPSFRTLPPETEAPPKDAPGTWTIRYILIPLQAGKAEVSLRLATFDTSRGEYRIAEMHRSLDVLPGTALAENATQTHIFPDTAASTGNRFTPEAHYLKPRLAGSVPLPLGKRNFQIAFLLFGAGPGVALLLHFLRKRRGGDALRKRHKTAELRRKQLLKHLDTPDCTLETIHAELTGFLTERHNLPRGSHAEEILPHLDDPELAAFLKEIALSAYAPGTEDFTEDKRRKLMKILKHLGILFVCLLLAAAAHPPADGFAAANAAFERGAFDEANEQYSRLLNPAAPDPAILYNRGCARYQKNDFAGALGDFSEALLLRPRDRAAADNLLLARSALKLPKEDTPYHRIPAVSFFRPDQWVLLAAALWFALCLSLGWTRWRKIRITLAAAALLAMLGATIVQYALYAPERGMAQVPLRVLSLPAETAGRLITELPPGTAIFILEQRDGWMHIQTGILTGWVRAGQIRTFLPQ